MTIASRVAAVAARFDRDSRDHIKPTVGKSPESRRYAVAPVDPLVRRVTIELEATSKRVLYTNATLTGSFMRDLLSVHDQDVNNSGCWCQWLPRAES